MVLQIHVEKRAAYICNSSRVNTVINIYDDDADANITDFFHLAVGLFGLWTFRTFVKKFKLE